MDFVFCLQSTRTRKRPVVWSIEQNQLTHKKLGERTYLMDILPSLQFCKRSATFESSFSNAFHDMLNPESMELVLYQGNVALRMFCNCWLHSFPVCYNWQTLFFTKLPVCSRSCYLSWISNSFSCTAKCQRTPIVPAKPSMQSAWQTHQRTS